MRANLSHVTRQDVNKLEAHRREMSLHLHNLIDSGADLSVSLLNALQRAKALRFSYREELLLCRSLHNLT